MSHHAHCYINVQTLREYSHNNEVFLNFFFFLSALFLNLPFIQYATIDRSRSIHRDDDHDATFEYQKEGESRAFAF